MDDWREAIWAAVPPGARPERFEERRAFLLEHIRRGDRVLDLGCGDGSFAAELVAAGASVSAADVAAEALRRAREAAPAATFIQLADGAALPFDGDDFDAVWIGETLEHVVDAGGLLAEVRRVLRPDGVLLVTTPNQPRLLVALEALRGGPLEQRLDPRSDHLRFFAAATLRMMLSDAGFLRVEIEAVGGWPLARPALHAVAR